MNFLALNVLEPRPGRSTVLRTVFRLALGAFLLVAGISHLTVNREAFLAQVPTWLPLEGDVVVVASGIVEIVLGASLLALGGSTARDPARRELPPNAPWRVLMGRFGRTGVHPRRRHPAKRPLAGSQGAVRRNSVPG